MIDVSKKPIVIIGQGPSAYQLADHIEEVRDKNVIWASLNRFDIIQDDILDLIGRKLDIVYCSSVQRKQEVGQDLNDFLYPVDDRPTLFITDKMSNPLLLNDRIFLSQWGFGFSSIFAMLCALGKLGAEKIIMIGFDGFAAHDGQVYFGQDKINDNFEARRRSIWRDTVIMNRFFWEYWEHIGLAWDQTEIINLSGSSITCFKRLAIQQIIREEI